MADPIAFTPYLGWVDATDPNNLPANVKLITAADLLRYEAFGRDAAARINSHGTAIGNLQTTVADHGTALTDLTAEVDALQGGRAVATKTAGYLIADTDSVILGNGAAITVTLPAAAGRTGRVFTVKNINAAALTVAAGGGSIDGAATDVLAQWESADYLSDGTNWFVI